MIRRIVAGLGFVLAFVLLAGPAWAAPEQVGLVDTSSGEWHLRNPDGSQRVFTYGIPGDVPLLGDWNCDGVDTPGAFRPSTGFVFLTNTNPTNGQILVADITYFFGAPGDVPFAGDWDGDGCDSPGIYRNGRVYTRDALSTGFADRAYYFGVPGDRPFATDWDGDGRDSVGIYRDATGQTFYTNDTPWTGVAATANDLFFGIGSDQFVPGDWDSNGTGTVGIYRPSQARFYLRNSNTTGVADLSFPFGQAGWVPVAGDTQLRTASLTPSTSFLDVGPVGVGGWGTANLTLTFSGSPGDADLRITAVEFGQNGLDYTAAPLADPDIGFGETRTIGVTLSPSTLGVKRGFIRIRHTGANSPLIVDLIGRSSYRVNAGGDPIADWGPDSPYGPGGSTFSTTAPVSGPTAPNGVFQSYRFGDQAWDFPLAPGAYRVNLYFAETFLNGPGQRRFDVSIEGTEVLSNFDVFAAAGGKNIGIVRGFDITSDGNLDIDFTGVVNSAAVQGIEIVPMPMWNWVGSSPSQLTYGSIAVGDTLGRTVTVVQLGEPDTGIVNIPGAFIIGPDADQFAITAGAGGRDLPSGASYQVTVEFRPTRAGVFDAELFISHSGPNSPLRVDLSAAADDVILYRLNTGGEAVVGQFSWSPDEAFLDPTSLSGELTIVEAINASDQSIPPGTPLNVLRTERFGSSTVPLRYDLPVPDGPYEVRLYFLEGVHNAAGVRVFDVNVEFGLAIDDLDVFARAGKNKAIMIPIQTNVSGGNLDIDLIPIPGRNLPAIHGIEVIRKVGNAFLEADPVSFTMGPIVTSGSFIGSVDVTNAGGAGIPSVVIEGVTITGPDAGRFTYLGGTVAGDVLPPGTTDQAIVRFVPGVIGDKQATLNITYNGGRVLSVPLEGSVNNPPFTANPGTRAATEGQPFEVTVTSTDPDSAGDGDFRAMTASGLPSWARVLASGDGFISIGGTPGFADAGNTVVTVTVTDPDGASDSESFTIAVANFNRAPTFNGSVPDRTNVEGDAVTISTEATDLDGDALTWSATGLPPGVTINPGSGLISGTVGFTAGDADPGVYNVVVTVTDNGSPNKSDTDSFIWTVSDLNQVPVPTPDITATVLEGGSVVVTLTATDGDGDPLTFNAFAPVNGTLDSVVQGPPDQEATVTFTHDGSETTTASFEFNASDGEDISGAATVTITVTPQNDPPVVTPTIAAVVGEGGSVIVTLTGSDPDGPTLSFSAFAPVNGSLGTVSQGILTDGEATVTFTHDGSETTTASFQFNATDGAAVSGAGTVSITVIPSNDAPVATPGITATVLEGGSVVVTLTATDGDGDPLSFNAFAPVNGTLGGVVQGPPDQQATVQFTHDGSETTTASFQFNASDGEEISGAATVTITVTPQNDPPIPTPGITAVVAEGGTVFVTITATDGDGDGLTFNAFSAVNGSVSVNQGSLVDQQAVVTYTHDGSETTTGSFQFNANDGTVTSGAEAVTITVNLQNDPPAPTNGITATVLEGGSVVVTLTGTDGDGDPLSFNAFAPVNGTLGGVVQGPPDQQATVQFNHDGSETTTASFQFNVNDGTVTSGAATVNLTVTPQNDPPTVTATINANVDEAESVVVTLTGSDPDGPTLSFNAFAPVNGTLGAVNQGVLTDGQATVTFTHDGTESPTASFQFNATDGTLTSGAGAVTITVNLQNDPPVPTNGITATVLEGGSVVVTLTGTDGDGDPLSFNAFAPVNGTLGGVVQGPPDQQATVQFNHDGSETTTASFQFNVNDGTVTSGAATVNLTVTPVDDPPVAVADSPGAVGEDSSGNVFAVLGNDTDVDGGPIGVASVTDPPSGAAAVGGGGANVTYSPDPDFCGLDSFSYTLTPGSSSATVSVTVTCVDDPPTAVGDAPSVAEGSSNNVFAVLGNDSDVDGGPIGVASVTQPANGTVVNNGSDVSYTPDGGYCNDGSPTDDFTYTLTPGGSSATVSVTVTCIDDPPVAVADSATVGEDSGASPIDVLTNDTDTDGGPRSVGSVTQPANGTVVNNGSNVTYAPDPNYCNDGSPTDDFTYTLTPGGSSATVSVTVTCTDDPPVVDPQGAPFELASTATAGTPIGTPLTFTDPELDSATAWTIDPADDPGDFFDIDLGGQLSLTANGVGNLVGPYVLSITVTAGGQTSLPVDFTINIV